MNQNMKRTLLGVLGVAALVAVFASTRKGPDVKAVPEVQAGEANPLTIAAPAATKPAATKPADTPAFVAAARTQFIEACDLAQTNKERARAVLVSLAANDQLPADVQNAAASLLMELSLPELPKAHQNAMRQATAAMLAADDLRRADDATDIRPWKRLPHLPLTKVVALVEPVIADAPDFLPAYLTLALALDAQCEYAKAAAVYEEYLRRHDALKLPASEQLREIRRRKFVAEARGQADAQLAALVFNTKWNASFASGAADFPAPVPAAVIELRGDGTVIGEGHVKATWRVQNRHLVLSGWTAAGAQWCSAGPLTPNGTTMVGQTLNANERCRYTKIP